MKVVVAGPLGVLTFTMHGPAGFGGVLTPIEVAVAEAIATGVPQKVTLVAPPRFVPVIVTEVPPTVDPDAGAIALIVVATAT